MDLFKVLKFLTVFGVVALVYILLFRFDYSDYSWDINKMNYVYLIVSISLIITGIGSYKKYKKDLEKKM